VSPLPSSDFQSIARRREHTLPDLSQPVMTVLGPISASELGVTLPHEHILLDITCYWDPPKEAGLQALADAPVNVTNLGLLRRNPLFIRDNCRLTDLDVGISEILQFRQLGGGTIVDLTLPEIGRDPVALQIASRSSGLHIVVGCGHYVHLSHPPELAAESVESIAARLISEITDGIDPSGVRPGIIGEIGISVPLHPREEKVLRAAARAQQATGLAVSLHLASPGIERLNVLGILESEGTVASRVVMGHSDNVLGFLHVSYDQALEYYRSLCERGCYVEFDCCGNEAYMPSALNSRSPYWGVSDRERAKALKELIDDGFLNNLLISQDICLKSHLVRYGGFGYGHILRNFVQSLRDFGVSTSEIHQLLVENPSRMLTPSKPNP
jgi:phosphotriesterase-related protein